MNHNEIRESIIRNLKVLGIDMSDVRVQPDPFEGWRIVVIAPGFEEKTASERKQIILSGLENIHVEWLELLTPTEKEWAGTLILDSDLEDLPLWPEALARTNLGEKPEQTIIFPSDLDENLDLPIVVTFYSVRGGVGRSTALAYTAKLLASRGRKVICVDMDLEAPGLAALFGVEADIREKQGLVYLLASLDRGEYPEITEHLLRVSELDDLYCLPAGRPDANYARLLRLIDPAAWYREEKNALRELFDRLAKDLPFTPDVVLLDSRTGITSLSGPLLFDLADLSIIVFFPHPQAKTATAALVRALLFSKTRRLMNKKRLTPEPRFLVSPIPASKVPEIVRRYEHRPLEWISDWLAEINDSQKSDGSLFPSDITHFVSYKETLATSDQILSDSEIWRNYETISDWIERFLPNSSEQQVSISLSNRKEDILENLSFSAGTAEQQEKFLNTFVETDLVKKALEPAILLVLGRKGTGKTAIFRRLLEDEKKHSIVVTSPSPLRGGRDWLLNPDGFQAVDGYLEEYGIGWRQFWNFYVCLACYYAWPHNHINKPIPDESISSLLPIKLKTQLNVIDLIEKIFTIPRFGVIVSDWLARLERETPDITFLLFDGLDTGFGNNDSDRDRRRRAIEGLLSFLIDNIGMLKKLCCKIVLREDIWKKLKFENKSHFFGRSVALKWSDQVTYFKVVIKQALLSEESKLLLPFAPNRKEFPAVDYWSDKEVLVAWNVLAGERMKGGKTAFTRNWVWNRLADSNDDHSPRYLLQLFQIVTEWEKREQKRNPYDRSIIRPRALIDSFPKVSQQALEALSQEEFPELEELCNKLKTIGRTPFPSDDLIGFDEKISLSREIGLLEVYEGNDENVERYRVPEIYRYALGMTRKGQA